MPMSKKPYKSDVESLMDELLAEARYAEFDPEGISSFLDPYLLTYYALRQDRMLWLGGEVDDDWCEFAKIILLWNKYDEDAHIAVKDRVPIKLLIHSDGGDLGVNNVLTNMIRVSRTPVWGVNMGQAYSAAACIYLSCYKRLAMPNSRFLLHSGGVENMSGSYEEVMAFASNYKSQIADITELIIERSNASREYVEDHMRADWFLSAQEAIDLGICDKLITDVRDLL